MNDNRSVSVGGNAARNVITTGDHNQVNAKIESLVENLPPAGSVDIKKELAEIRSILERIPGEHTAKIGRALDDATEEAHKSDPNKQEIGSALSRALDYAKKGAGFVEEIGKLSPHLMNAVAALGPSWHQLLSYVGLGT
ncbi:MAG: hypothetical protein ACJ71W_14645 [Terriglobales bacterium]